MSKPAEKSQEQKSLDKTPPASKSSKYYEDIFAEKLDMCFTDTVIKAGAGGLLGGMTSLFFLRRARWPMIAGMGIGIGLAWANCEHELNAQTQKALLYDK